MTELSSKALTKPKQKSEVGHSSKQQDNLERDRDSETDQPEGGNEDDEAHHSSESDLVCLKILNIVSVNKDQSEEVELVWQNKENQFPGEESESQSSFDWVEFAN